jgi:exodeoxyribonuclease VII large subunit
LEGAFSGVQVEGEISDLIQHRSGHWYFTLKDDEGQLRAAMFSFKNKSVRFKPENGQQVVLTGKLSLYAPRGSYQFITERMAPAGVGELQQAFEALKRDLEKQGLFEPEHKKPLPNFPRQVAIITSPQGAAIRDIQTTFERRFCGIQLIVIPVAVQGDGAAQAIANAIDTANRWSKDNQTDT